MDVSIIYVNYKTNNILLNSIISLRDKTIGCKYEIIIVDNSDDPQIFKDLKGKVSRCDNTVKIINANGNIGFGRANNLGAQYANGKYLLFLNTDTLLINDAITKLKEYLDKHSNVGIVGPNILDKERNPAHSFFKNEKNLENIYKNNGMFSRLISKIQNKRNDYNYTGKPIEIKGYVCGACLMIRKNVFENLKGFDNEIFMYAEETLLCYRTIHEMNMKIYNIPEASLVHLEGASFNEFSKHRVEMMVDGNSVYLEKAFGIDVMMKYLRKDIKINYALGILDMLLFFNKNNYFSVLSTVEKRKLKILEIENENKLGKYK